MRLCGISIIIMTAIFCVLFLAIVAGHSNAVAQGYFMFQNYDTLYGVNIDAPVYNFDGTPLYGTNYLASLYGGLTQQSLMEAVDGNSGQPLRVPFTYTPNGAHGYFAATRTYAAIQSVAPGNTVWLQVRAWDARLGNSYEEAIARGVGGYGASPLFTEIAPANMMPPTPLDGLQSFTLVPEPSSIILLLGGMIFLVRRLVRIKRKMWESSQAHVRPR